MTRPPYLAVTWHDPVTGTPGYLVIDRLIDGGSGGGLRMRDGCTLDASGRIWAADEVGARCALVAEGGEIVDEIAAPEGLNIFACMLGGDDGRTLLLCAAPDFAEHNRSAAREAVLLTTTVQVPHAGLP